MSESLDRIVNEKIAADLCGLSPRTIRRRRRAGDLPHIRIGRRVLFRVSDLQTWLDAHRRQTAVV